MRTLEQFLGDYAESHQNPTNRLIHFICVPTIFFSTLGLMWAVPVAAWFGGPAWINLGTLFAVATIPFYARLSLGSLMAMTLWALASFAGIVAIERLGGPLVAICAGLWLAAWALQFYGHKVEGAKPSFADDLVFLLIGPLFVQRELFRGGAESHA